MVQYNNDHINISAFWGASSVVLQTRLMKIKVRKNWPLVLARRLFLGQHGSDFESYLVDQNDYL